jgi:hypothetical protein
MIVFRLGVYATKGTVMEHHPAWSKSLGYPRNRFRIDQSPLTASAAALFNSL